MGVLCALLAWIGAFAPPERATLDARFRHAQPATLDLSDDIRLIEIDDGAIESVGRWPWARSLLGDAILELERAGARVVALDLLLDDPSEPDWEPLADQPGQLALIDHDAELAGDLARASTVLAIDVPFNLDPFEELFLESERARAAFARFRENLTPGANGANGANGEEGEHADFVPEDMSLRRLQYLAALSVAVERRAALHADEPDDLDALRRVLLPTLSESVGSSPTTRMLARVELHARSLHIVASALGLSLPTTVSPRDAIMLARIAPPAPTVAFAGDSFGFVNFAADPDSVPRRMPPTQPTPFGDTPQFGLAAAAVFAGVNPSAIRIADGRVRFEERSIALTNGRILIPWPSPKAFAASSDERRMSLGALISLARNRGTLERLTQQRAALAAAIQNTTAESIDEESLASVRDLVALRMAERQEILDAGETLSPEEIEYLAPFVRFSEVERAVDTGAEALAHAEAEVRRRVEDRLCFVGWSASGALADFVTTPLGERTPGVVVHAVLADSLLTGRHKTLAPAWLDPFLAFAFALLGALLVAAMPTGLSLAAFLTLLLAHLGLNGYAAFRYADIALPLVAPAIAFAVSWGLCTTIDAAAARLERARIQRQFKARVSPQLVERLADDPDALAVDGQAREITVLFLDVAGFTSLSERLDGPQTVALINDCMRAFTAALTKRDAYVNKFLGDGLMAFWSAFADDPDQADKAVRAAAECLDAIERVNDRRRETDPDAPPLSVRVGVATGVAIVGDCGAPPDLNDYTAIGNAVNLASRLEGAGKAFGARAIIDDRTRELLKQSPARPLRRLGRVVVVGQSVPVEIFELPYRDVDTARSDAWAHIVDSFEAGEFDDCLRRIAAYDATLDDPCCARLRESIEDLRELDGGAGAAPFAIRLRSK